MSQKRSRNLILAFGLAGFGLCLCLCIPIGGAVLFPVFAQARERARQQGCMNNLKSFTIAMLAYTEDHNGILPPASQWCDAVRPYGVDESVYRCPKNPPGNYGYAMNSRLSRQELLKVGNPEQTPMLYDSSNLAWNAHDPFTSLPDPPRHLGGNNIAFADGQVRYTKP